MLGLIATIAQQLDMTEPEAEALWNDRHALKQLVESRGFRALAHRRMNKHFNALVALEHPKNTAARLGYIKGQAQEAHDWQSTLEGYYKALLDVKDEWEKEQRNGKAHRATVQS